MSSSQSKKKVVIIGAGMVGSTVAYTILMNHLAAEIVLIDIDKERAKGEALDMNHGIAFLKQIDVRSGDYRDCEDADIIIITAGLGRKPGQTRLDLAKVNVAIAKDITKNIMEHNRDPLILVISNPVDILTYVVQKESGLSPKRVFGSGTTLDTGRFRFLLSEHCKVDVRNVHGYIIGEHGDSQVPVWSKANIAGKSFDEYCGDCPRKCKKVNRADIAEKTRTAGAEIINNKGATYYGIALAASRIVSSIIGNEHSVLTVSSVVSGEYGVEDIALSLPCVINSSGIERIMTIQLNDDEIRQLHESEKILKDILTQVY